MLLIIRDFQEPERNYAFHSQYGTREFILNDVLDIAEDLQKIIMGGPLTVCIFSTTQGKCECLIPPGFLPFSSAP